MRKETGRRAVLGAGRASQHASVHGAGACEEARRGFEGLRKRRLDTFMAGFSVITLRLKEM